jgi:uncharacterized protein GlcG (DUF336 family)
MERIMTPLNLAQAQIIAQAALAKGREAGFKPLAVIVLDHGGIPIAYLREDGSSNLRFDIARGKAFGALGLGVSSRMIGQMAAERPAFIQAAIAASDGRMIPTAGGVIIHDDQGNVLGAVGVSGDTSDNDEICALAGIASAGLKAAV